jgi:hypothetical protein
VSGRQPETRRRLSGCSTRRETRTRWWSLVIRLGRPTRLRPFKALYSHETVAMRRRWFENLVSLGMIARGR